MVAEIGESVRVCSHSCKVVHVPDIQEAIIFQTASCCRASFALLVKTRLCKCILPNRAHPCSGSRLFNYSLSCHNGVQPFSGISLLLPFLTQRCAGLPTILKHLFNHSPSCHSGYLLRFLKEGNKPGDTVYLITANWFKAWQEHTGYQVGHHVA